MRGIMLMTRRREMLEQGHVEDTTVKIKYNKYWIRANCALTTNSTNTLCVSEWYEIENPGSVKIRFRTTNKDTVVKEYIVHAQRPKGDTGTGYRICLVSQTEVRNATDFNTVSFTSSKGYSEVRFTLDENALDVAYAYVVETGQVIFAGRNSPYYGKLHI